MTTEDRLMQARRGLAAFLEEWQRLLGVEVSADLLREALCRIALEGPLPPQEDAEPVDDSQQLKELIKETLELWYQTDRCQTCGDESVENCEDHGAAHKALIERCKLVFEQAGTAKLNEAKALS